MVLKLFDSLYSPCIVKDCNLLANCSMDTKVKVKSVPLQAWSGPEFCRNLMFPDFMTMVQNGGKVVSFMHRPHLPPGNDHGTNFC